MHGLGGRTHKHVAVPQSARISSLTVNHTALKNSEGEGAAPVQRLQEGKEEAESAEAKAERMEKVLDQVFNRETSPAALLKQCTKATINYVTKQESYSPLTVLSSRPDVTEKEMKQAMFLGADKFHQDEDGCSALHWAAMKGVVAATAVLTAAASGSALAEVGKLLEMKDGDGKTPLDLAKESIEPNHEEVEALLIAVRLRLRVFRLVCVLSHLGFDGISLSGPLTLLPGVKQYRRRGRSTRRSSRWTKGAEKCIMLRWMAGEMRKRGFDVYTAAKGKGGLA